MGKERKIQKAGSILTGRADTAFRCRDETIWTWLNEGVFSCQSDLVTYSQNLITINIKELHLLLGSNWLSKEHFPLFVARM